MNDPLAVLREKRDLFVISGFRDDNGIWHDGPHIIEFDQALADIEALLEAAKGVMTQMDYQTPHHTRLMSALAPFDGESD